MRFLSTIAVLLVANRARRRLPPWLALLAITIGAVSAAAEGLPPIGQCPVMPAAIAKQVALEIKGSERCYAYCEGCGCKGGPGYRKPNGQCVSYAALVRECGEAPHAVCQPECAPVVEKCAGVVPGKALLRSVAERLGLQLSFIQGSFSFAAKSPAPK